MPSIRVLPASLPPAAALRNEGILHGDNGFCTFCFLQSLFFSFRAEPARERTERAWAACKPDVETLDDSPSLALEP
jgi:hypothetical protein